MSDEAKFIPRIETHQITIVSPSGRPAALIGADDEGVVIALAGADQARIQIGGGAEEFGILLRDREGRPQISIGMSADGTSRIALVNHDGESAVALTMVDEALYVQSGEVNLPLYELVGALAAVAKSRRPAESKN